MTPDDRAPDLRPSDHISHAHFGTDKGAPRIEPTDPPAKPLPLASKILLAIILLVVLTFLIPALGWVVGNVVVPWWHQAFAWL